MKYSTCVDEGCMTFGYEIVIKNRVCVWFWAKSVGPAAGERDRKAAVCDNKFDGVQHG